MESASAAVTLASLAVRMDWFCRRNAAVEKSSTRGVCRLLHHCQAAAGSSSSTALPIHLLRHPVSFKSDWYRMVQGETWEIPSAQVVLPWVASLPYIFKDQLDMWNPVGIFANQNNRVLLTLDWIISSNEKFCNLITCEEKYNFFSAFWKLPNAL